MCTWEEIGEKWSRAQQMGYQAVQAALDVGDELVQKKLETPRGEFVQRVGQIGVGRSSGYNLMRLALHRELIEQHRPDSMRGALALLPKVPRLTSDKQIAVKREELDKMQEFAKEPAKKQADAMAKRMVRIELDRLQNQAHDAITKELKAVRGQLEKERMRVSELMAETAEKRQFYEDLINKRMNGYDFRGGLKVLRQAVHPDREEASQAVRSKAVDVIKHLSELLQL